jgi:hypothetical protein
MTFAEIQTAVQGNPALLNEIATGFGKDIIPVIGQNDELVKGIVPVLGQKGFVVRSKADEESYLNTYKSQVIEQEIPTRIKEVHDKYDEDLFTLTGERKAPTEKTYDFLKRKISEIKASKIDDPVLKEQLTTLQKTLESKDKEHKTALEKMESDYFKRELNGMVSNALDTVNIAIPAHLKTDEEKQKYVASQKNMMKRDMLDNVTAKKDKDGNVVFYNGEQPLTSTTDGKPLQAIDLIKDRYGFYLAAETQKTTGAGTGGNGGADGKFTTKEQVMEHLKAKGLKPLTKAFSDEYGKIIKEQGIMN